MTKYIAKNIFGNLENYFPLNHNDQTIIQTFYYLKSYLGKDIISIISKFYYDTYSIDIIQRLSYEALNINHQYDWAMQEYKPITHVRIDTVNCLLKSLQPKNIIPLYYSNYILNKIGDEDGTVRYIFRNENDDCIKLFVVHTFEPYFKKVIMIDKPDTITSVIHQIKNGCEFTHRISIAFQINKVVHDL